MSIRIGSVPYLNEKPLTRWFSHTDAGRASGVEVVYAVPSELARMLQAGEIAAALVSSFEYFRTPGYAVVPGISISGQDDIESVRAFARVPWRKIESLALDTSSLTSAALLKILLAEQLELPPRLPPRRAGPGLDAGPGRCLPADRGQGDAGGRARAERPRPGPRLAAADGPAVRLCRLDGQSGKPDAAPGPDRSRRPKPGG